MKLKSAANYDEKVESFVLKRRSSCEFDSCNGSSKSLLIIIKINSSFIINLHHTRLRLQLQLQLKIQLQNSPEPKITITIAIVIKEIARIKLELTKFQQIHLLILFLINNDCFIYGFRRFG